MYYIPVFLFLFLNIVYACVCFMLSVKDNNAQSKMEITRDRLINVKRGDKSGNFSSDPLSITLWYPYRFAMFP